MGFKLRLTREAKDHLAALEKDLKKLKKVRRCLGQIQIDPRHPGLNSHKYSVMKTEDRKDLWESYVENNTPAAWRVFWFYGPEGDMITITAIIAIHSVFSAMHRKSRYNGWGVTMSVDANVGRQSSISVQSEDLGGFGQFSDGCI